MDRTSTFISSKLPLILLAAMALALGACGRKGGLDLPPSASAAPTSDGLSVVEPEPKNAAAVQSNLYNSGNPSDRTHYAPTGPQKRIILDSILD